MAEKPTIDEIKFVTPEPEAVEIPKQPEFYRLPVRFGSVPVDEAPPWWYAPSSSYLTQSFKAWPFR